MHHSHTLFLEGMPGADHELPEEYLTPASRCICIDSIVSYCCKKAWYIFLSEKHLLSISQFAIKLKYILIYFEYKCFYIFKLYPLISSAYKSQAV